MTIDWSMMMGLRSFGGGGSNMKEPGGEGRVGCWEWWWMLGLCGGDDERLVMADKGGEEVCCSIEEPIWPDKAWSSGGWLLLLASCWRCST